MLLLPPSTRSGVVAPIADLGAGLGAATVWLGDRAHVTMVGVEPQPNAARLASQVFAGLRVVVGTATATPLKAGSCGGAALLGVVSLVDDLGPTLAEVVRVVRPGGIVVISDLCATRRAAASSTRVAERVPNRGWARRRAASRKFAPTAEWRASADRPTAWDDAGRRVDEEIERHHGHSDVFRAWQADRQRLARLIDGGELEVATVSALLRG